MSRLKHGKVSHHINICYPGFYIFMFMVALDFHWSWLISVSSSSQLKVETVLCGLCGGLSDLGLG